SNTVETIIGAIVVAIAGIFLWYTYTTTNAGTLTGYEITARLPRADGTSTGLLGGSYVSITPGGSDKMLPPGGQITNVQGAVDLMGLVGRFIGGGNNGGQQKPAPQPQPSVPGAHP